MSNANNNILKYLLDIETMHGVKVLFAVESGSRQWGFNSDDSDYDVRFIYKRPASWYLSILERRDVIERTFEDKLFDFCGWDLKKALYQIYKGNPCIMEWFYSDAIYLDAGHPVLVMDELLGLSKRYFNPRASVYHYLHMAQGNYKQYILNIDQPMTKKYLYVCRPLLCCIYIEKYSCQPRGNMDVLMENVKELVPIGPFNDIKYVMTLKRNGLEKEIAPKIIRLNEWIEDRLEHFKKCARLQSKASCSTDELDDYFMKKVLEIF